MIPLNGVTPSNSGAKKRFFERLLNPLKGTAVNNLDIYGFDVETERKRQDFKRKNGNKVVCYKQEFILGSIYGKDGFCKVFKDRHEMCDYLLSRKLRDSLMFATNLSFDHQMLYYDNNDFFFIYRKDLIGAIKTIKTGRNKHRWKFLDTINFWAAGVDKLGSIVGVPKMEKPKFLGLRPKNKEEWEELIRYNINDSKITYMFADKLRDFCNHHNMKMKFTIASTGLDFWRRNYQDRVLKKEPEWILKKHFLGSFRGGMTNCYKRGLYENKCYYYDYSSSYPSVMFKGVDGTGEYPEPTSAQYTSSGTTDIIENYDGICNCEIKSPYMYIPPICIKRDSRLIFPYGKFKSWITNKEARVAMDEGYEIKPFEMIYYTSNFRPFKEAVKYLYNIRKEYKKQKHPYNLMVKLLMNSGLFGKFGFNFLESEEMIPLKKVIFNEKGQAFVDNKLIEKYDIYGTDIDLGFLSVKKECKSPNYSFPILSEYTTMLGRIKLWSDIKKHEKSLIYTDTDSAIMSKKVFETGDCLGDFELEHTINKALFVRAKLYMFDTDNDTYCKSKGIGKFMNTGNNFMSAINNKKVDINRFTKLKESAKIGIKSGSIIEMTKHLNLEDDKRVWNKPFNVFDWQDSKPIFLKTYT